LKIEIESRKKGFDELSWISKRTFKSFIDKDENKLNNEGQMMKLYTMDILKMAPIYDSGSSLVRELDDSQVKNLLNDSDKLNKYIEKGTSELHWVKQKLTHFDLINKIKNDGHEEDLLLAANFLAAWDNKRIEDTVLNIDANIPDLWKEYRIPEHRKLLMIKILNLRVEKLREKLS
jgi:hypothetical protein